MEIKRKHNIVIYSLPGETTFMKLHREDFGASPRFDPVDDYFVIRPFNDNGPRVYIRADVHEPFELEPFEIEFDPGSMTSKTTQAAYEKMVERATRVAAEMQGKVVLSRIDLLDSDNIDILGSLKKLREKFPNAFVYFIHAEAFGTWMGATPETLVEHYDDDFHTMALAGTKHAEEDFTQKEFDEQVLVARDILERLHDVPVEVGDVHEHAYGELKHLRTLFQWKSVQPINVFAERIHPTPAVAGYPRKEALEAIRAIELHDRSLYTGYLGLIRGKGVSQLFVNLRCMQLFRDQLWYYTGGGVNAQSDPVQEWEETEQKKNAVLSALAYED